MFSRYFYRNLEFVKLVSEPLYESLLNMVMLAGPVSVESLPCDSAQVSQ
jgi:hypothetical protein